MPVLLLWGGADPISPPAAGRKLLELLPSAELCVIEGGDHAFAHDRRPGGGADHQALPFT
jgi:pimeloyl-ACP methyl ester carboxylesterase